MILPLIYSLLYYYYINKGLQSATNENLFYGSCHDADFYRHNEDCDEEGTGCNEVGCNGVDYNGGDYSFEDAFPDTHPYPTSCVAFESHEGEHRVHTFQQADGQKDLRHTS
tara:strand:+ start:119 stop:451 length:333 start_codon:yes stop_codon:yes gene_type:complete